MVTLPSPLGDGLVLRAARPDDAEQLVALNGAMHAEPDMVGSDELIIGWTSDLFDLPHPTFRLDHTTVVEDTTTGRIVSTVFPIPQRWSYAGTPLLVNRPELVATDPAYRRRGLIRAQFDLIHRRGDSAGEMLQFITGIPWYYRQFGYEYALDLGPHPTMRVGDKPAPTDGRFSVRPATPVDVAFLAGVDAAACASPFLRCTRDVDTWQLELNRRTGALPNCCVYIIDDIEDADAPRSIGYAVHQHHAWGTQLPLRAFELLPGHAWLGPTAAVVAHAQTTARDRGLTGITLALSAEHPALHCARTGLAPPFGAHYGLYVRVADVPGFVRAVAAVLERRLAASPATNYSGQLRLDFYNECLQIEFKEGCVTAVGPWRPDNDDDHGDAGMPRDAFLHLLLGNRTITELEASYADCSVHSDAGGLLLDVLFPHMPLDKWWLG